MARNGRAVGSGGSGCGRSLRTLSAVVAGVVLAGCYVYVPAEPGTVSPGAEVRVRVDRSVPLSVGEVPLPDDGHVIRGTLLAGPSMDTLLCSVLLTPMGSSFGPGKLRGTVSIPAGAVEELGVRHLAKGRTASLVGAGVVLSAVIVKAAFDIHNAREGTDQTPGVDNALITLLRVRW